MSENIKKYILQRNYILENFDKITEDIIYELLINYYSVSLVSLPNIDNDPGALSKTNELYKELLTVSLTTQDVLLNLVTIFILFKRANTDFLKYLFNSSNIMTPEQSNNILPIIEMLNNVNNVNSMKGGQPATKIILKTIGLLSLLMGSVLTVKSDVQSDSTMASYMLTPLNGETETLNQVALVLPKTQDDNFLLPPSFSQERELEAEQSRRETVSKYGTFVGTVSNLFTFQQTDEDLIDEFKFTVGQLQFDYTAVYSEVSKTCSNLVDKIASEKLFTSGFLEQPLEEPSEDESQTIYESVTTAATETMESLFSGFLWSSSEKKTVTQEPITQEPITQQEEPLISEQPVSSQITTPSNEMDIASQKNQIAKILQNAQTSQIVAQRKTNEGVKNALLGFCQSQFKPKIELDISENQMVIKRNVNGYPNFSNQNAPNYFDNFIDILNVIQTTANNEIQSKQSGFITSSAQETDELKDIIQKANIFIQIMENTKSNLYFFETKQEFQLHTENLKVNLESITDLVDIFKQFLPQDYLNKLEEQRKAASLSEQENKLAEIEHEAVIKSTKAENVRNKESLEVGNETVSNREEYVRQTVKGTLGIGFAAADETLAEAGKVVDRVGDFFMKYIKELLLLSGGAVTLYAIYALITLRMMTARSAKVPTTTQITNASTTMSATANQQQIVTLFNNNVGLVTSADVTGNGKLVGILQTYFADANSAVALINLQKYFDNLPFDKKVIIYIEPPDNNFRCGRYRGLDTRNNKIIIGLENGTNVFKNYDDIIDPISNDYNSNLYDVLEKCIQTINRPPTAPLISNETDGMTMLSNAASTLPSLPLNAPSGGKKKTVKRRPKKNNKKTIQKHKNVKKRATKKNNKTNKKKKTTKH